MSLPSGSLQEPRALRLSGPLRGALRVPGSKSLAQRALLAAALARGRTELVGLPGGEDVRAALALVRDLGAGVEEGEVCVIEGLGGAARTPSPCLSLGESGTLARLATALMGLNGPGRALLMQPSGSLRLRRSEPLLACLRAAGVRIECVDEPTGSWPLSISGTQHPGMLTLHDPVSSQEVSALWLASAVERGGREVLVCGPIPSAPYLDLTEQVLASFGVALRHDRSQPGQLSTRLGGPLLSPGSFEIEADASSAAVALAAACLSGGELCALGLPARSVQGDLAILDYLGRFGCSTERRVDGLFASGKPTCSASLDLGSEPDLAPVLAIVAAAAAEHTGEACELRGLGTLRGKESDRVAVLARGLDAAGWRVNEEQERLVLGAPHCDTPPGLVLDPAGDHRMAFAFALLGILRPGILVANPGCVAKSWPSFWDDLELLG